MLYGYCNRILISIEGKIKKQIKNLGVKSFLICFPENEIGSHA